MLERQKEKKVLAEGEDDPIGRGEFSGSPGSRCQCFILDGGGIEDRYPLTIPRENWPHSLSSLLISSASEKSDCGHSEAY
jgi:hypothetical protein